MSQDPGQALLNSGLNFTPTIHNDAYAAISPQNFDLGSKTVLITGASRGCGKAIALAFAAAGASGIALGARSNLDGVEAEVLSAAREARRAQAPKVVKLELDVSDGASVEKAKGVVEKEFGGKLDVLISMAGRLSPFVPLTETDPQDWWEDYTVNVLGTYLTTRAFLPLLLASPTKLLLNTTSIGAMTLTPHASAYSTSKLAVLRFAEHMDADHGPRTPDGLISIAVRPGAVKTDLGLRVPEKLHGFLTDSAELVAGWCVWAAAERREWLSGRYVGVNWDVAELVGMRERIVGNDLLKVRMAVTPF